MAVTADIANIQDIGMMFSECIVRPGKPDILVANASVSHMAFLSDIAGVVAFLCSENARWITGQHILANGGGTT